MAAEAQGRYTGTSFDSLQAAADEALDQVPPGPEGIKVGKIVGQMLQEGGVVGRRQYTVIIQAGAETDGGEGGYTQEG
jgi:flavin-binding protein dodecin